MKLLKRKKIQMVLCGVLFPLLTYAQIATWHVHPYYESIKMLENTVIVGKKEGKTSFWKATAGEKDLIHETTTQIKEASFRDDCVVFLEAGTANIYGFLTRDCKFVSLKGKGYMISNDYPFFSDGFLLVTKIMPVGKNGDPVLVNYFIDKTGTSVYGPFANAQPFHKGFAPVKKFLNMEKNAKDVVYDFVSSDSSHSMISESCGETFAFCSSLNEKGEAIVVIDKKVYSYNLEKKEMTQLYTEDVSGRTEKEKKKLLVLTPNSRVELRESGSEVCLDIKQGELAFDKYWNILSIRYNNQSPKNFSVEEQQPYKFTSTIAKTPAKEGLYGLTYKGDLLMPEQFEEVVNCADDLAVVKFKGHYGVLAVDPEAKFTISVNDGKGNESGIGFKHRTQDAKLELLFPVNIQPENARLEAVDGINLCKIKTGSRKNISNEENCGLRYDCTLTIPQDDLPSAYQTCKPYYFHVIYECLDGQKDGLQSKEIEVCINEWYVKLYDVEIKDPNYDIDINQDNIRINFELKRSSMTNDDDYTNFFNVEATSENGEVVYECTPLSAGKYYFDMPIGEEKLLKFEIHIFEEGCPPNVYPHTVSIDFKEDEQGNPQTKTKTVTIRRIEQRKPDPKPIPQPTPIPDDDWDIDKH